MTGRDGNMVAEPAAVRCAPWITWGAGDAALALFDTRDGSYHALNETASAIWQALSAGRQPAEVADLLAAGRPALHQTIAEGVDAFVAAALSKGLLIAHENFGAAGQN